LLSTTCPSRSGAVINISSVPVERSSAKSRMVNSGGMTQNTSQKPTLPSRSCIGNSVPTGPRAVSFGSRMKPKITPMPARNTPRTTYATGDQK
jgi:hypothetical protein